MLAMPVLQTGRLIIRPFKQDDLDAVYRILDVDLAGAPGWNEGASALEERRLWLQWTVLNYDQLAGLDQPPYGDRAVVLKSTGELIGSVGYVPCLDHFSQLPYFANRYGRANTLHRTVELRLFYAVATAFPDPPWLQVVGVLEN